MLIVRLWRGWMRFSVVLGNVVSRAVLTLFYFTLVVPFALWARLTTDPLQIGKKARQAGPTWHQLPAASEDGRSMRRQG